MRSKVPALAVFVTAMCFLPVFAAVTEVRPGQSIERAARSGGPGTIIAVRAGVYQDRDIIPNDGLTIVSIDGPGMAKVDAGGRGKTFFLWHRKNVTIDGFECFNSADNVVMVTEGKNCVLRNLYVHDAGAGGDCIKVNVDTEDLLIENCVTHTPGGQPDRNEVEECIDLMHSKRVTVRGCWLYYTGKEKRANQLGYSKCDCFDIVWENCVFGPTHVNNEVGDAAIGGGWAGSNKSGWNSVGVTYRNNLFIDCHHGALGIYGQKDVYIINNTFVNNGHLGHDIIDIHEGGAAKHAENIHIFNNVFVDYLGKMPAQGPLGFTNGSYKDIHHGGNIYWNAGKPVPSSRLLNPRNEQGAGFVDPLLLSRSLPEITAETTALSLFKAFALAPASPARDVAVPLEGDQFRLPADALGSKRPQGAAVDIGAVEFKTAARPASESPTSTASAAASAAQSPIAAFSDDIAEARRLADAGDFKAAGTKAAELAGKAEDAGAKAALDALRQGFADAQTLRNFIIKRHKQTSPTVYVDFGGMTARGKVTSADQDGVSVAVMGADLPIPWNKLEPLRLLGMAARFADENNGDELLAVARFAAAAGLKEKAEAAIQKFLQAAPGRSADVKPLEPLIE